MPFGFWTAKQGNTFLGMLVSYVFQAEVSMRPFWETDHREVGGRWDLDFDASPDEFNPEEKELEEDWDDLNEKGWEW